MTPLFIIIFYLLIMIAFFLKRNVGLVTQVQELNATSHKILTDYQDCITLLKDESARASLYYQKYMIAIGGHEYGEVKTGVGGGKSGIEQ